jgi:hypothetical protein
VSREHSTLLAAALNIARKGKPVFPCKPDKSPYTLNGFKDASTDPSKITAWWTRWPNANVGIPTGEASGILALDSDNPDTLDALQEKHSSLPPTATTRTGRGGMHYLLRYPAGETIRNSTGKLGPGLDVRGEGGYIIVPPSRTEGAYEWVDKSPLADLPDWLLEALTEQPRASKDTPRIRPAAVDVSGPAIPEGTRDETLTRIAGRLHDGSRALADLGARLQAVNEARCTPPLPQAQVWKIARSIHERPPCSPGPDQKALEALVDIEAAFWRSEWRGIGGKSERDVMVALIKLAGQHGRLVEDGVQVSVSIRELALLAAISKRSAIRVVKRLVEAGWISRLKPDTNGTSGAFVLRRAHCHHSIHRGGYREGEEEGDNLRAPLSAPRLRWPAPTFDRVGDEVIRTTIRRSAVAPLSKSWRLT